MWTTKNRRSRQLASLSWTGSVRFHTGTATASNLATTFHPSVPMNEPGMSKEKVKVLMDVPTELQRQLNEGLDMIGVNCLKGNAEIVLSIYEEIMVEHVL